MAIEIIPKKVGEKLPAKLNILFYLSIILLLISILSYFALGFWQKNSARTLENLEKLLAGKETPEFKDLEKKIFGYQKKIADFSNLLSLHHSLSNFFTFLENLSHPDVFFSKLDLNVKESKVSLSGKAESFEALGQQLLIFKKEKFVKNINLSKVLIEKEGKIEFFLEISFDPQIFRY